MSWEQTNVNSLRRKLVEVAGMTEEEAASIKYKSNLIMKFVEKGLEYEDVFGDREIEPEELDIQGSELLVENTKQEYRHEPVGVEYAGSGWTEYIMSKFCIEELDDGHPKLSGLRRVVETELGEIVFSGPVHVDVYHPQDPLEPGRATVTYEIKIAFKYNKNQYEWIPEHELKNYELPLRTFRAVGGAYMGNTEDLYSPYYEAIAESRAEARALRKALQIDTIAADETSPKARTSVKDFLTKKEKEVTSDYDETGLIDAGQISAINLMAKRLGIDTGKVSLFLLNKPFLKEDGANNLTKAEGTQLLKNLNLYQTNTEIPEEVKL